MNEPQISVVLPVYNGAAFVESAVRSILHQDGVEHEVVVVDDGSTDATPAILSAIADQRLRVVRTPPGGLVAALNTGIATARAPVIARMDADDLALPGRLAAQIARMDDADFVFAAAELIDMQGRLIGHNACPPLTRDERRAALLGEAVAPPLIHPTAMMSRDALILLGGYRESPVCEDHELWLRAIDHFRIATIATPLLRYRVNPSGMSRQKSATQGISNILNCIAYRVRVARGIDLMTDRPDLYVRLRSEAERRTARLFDKLVAARRVRSAVRHHAPGESLRALSSLRLAGIPLLSREAQRRATLVEQMALFATVNTWLDGT